MDFITFNNITFSYPERMILKNTSFSIPKYGITLLTGPNGIGKTTLFKLISGKLSKDTISFSSKNNIIFLDENILVLDELFPIEFLNFFCASFSIKNDYAEKILNDFNKIGINNFFESVKIKNLSLGETKKIMLLLNILLKPDILLLDEPFNGLDTSSRKFMIDLLEKYSNYMSIILITHENINEIKYKKHLKIENFSLIEPELSIDSNCHILDSATSTIIR